MGLASIVTLVGVFLLVGAVAAYLIVISFTLNVVSSNLDKVLNNVIRRVVEQAQPLESVVSALAGDVAAIQSATDGLVSRSRGGARHVADGGEERAWESTPSSSRRRSRASR